MLGLVASALVLPSHSAARSKPPRRGRVVGRPEGVAAAETGSMRERIRLRWDEVGDRVGVRLGR